MYICRPYAVMYVCKSVRSTYVFAHAHAHTHRYTCTHLHTTLVHAYYTPPHVPTHTTLKHNEGTIILHFTIVGENAGRPLLSVAETRAGPLGEGKKTKGASNILSHAREVI